MLGKTIDQTAKDAAVVSHSFLDLTLVAGVCRNLTGLWVGPAEEAPWINRWPVAGTTSSEPPKGCQAQQRPLSWCFFRERRRKEMKG